MWLHPTLLFLCLPSCLSLKGPGYVNGTEGATPHVRCQYDVGYKGRNKYWCRGEHDIGCESIVETKGGERLERNGRVSIRDHADDLTVTATIEDLQEQDAGTYWCKIQTVWIWDELARDVAESVKVYVYPRCPLASFYLLLPVFMKLPLFLSMLCAVFWVNRPQKAAGERRSQPVQEPCGALPEECPVPGSALETGPEGSLVLESLAGRQQ